MKKFRMPTNQEVKDQAAKGQYMNAPRITLIGLEIISEQLDQMNKKLDRVLKFKKEKIKKGVVP